MDTGLLVVEQIPAGERFVRQFVRDGHSVKAAFWLHRADDGESFLYLVTDLVDEVGPTKTYGLVNESLRKVGPSLGLLSLDEVKVVSPDDEAARFVQGWIERRPPRTGSHVRGTRHLGRLEADYLYIYRDDVVEPSTTAPASTEAVARRILELLERSTGILPVSVVLTDGTRFDGVPFGLQVGADRALVAQFVASGEAVPRVVRVDQIASID